MIIASEGEKKDFTPISAGTIQGVCYDIWDIGLQKGEWKGEKIIQHKIIIGFEVTELVQEGELKGKRMVTNKFYTLSLGEKANLRKDLESWRGRAFTETELKGFDIETLVGANAMLSIVHTEKGKAKISGISKLMVGLPTLTPENARSVPKWVEDFQAKAVEYPDDGSESTNNGTIDAGENSSIPF